MAKSQRKITNPMTIIAIFSAISETSAAISLPFLDDQDRQLYVWFLISFPFYLLLLFFITLNFNYKSLYAPSDFEKGKHFIKVIENIVRTKKQIPKDPNPTHPPNNRQTSGKPDTFTTRLIRCFQPGTTSAPTGQHNTSWNPREPVNEVRLLTGNATQYNLHLPGYLQSLDIVDARGVMTGKDFDALMAKVIHRRRYTEVSQDSPITRRKVILFLTDKERGQAVLDNRLRQLKGNKEDPTTASYMTYNLSTLALTLIHQA